MSNQPSLSSKPGATPAEKSPLKELNLSPQTPSSFGAEQGEYGQNRKGARTPFPSEERAAKKPAPVEEKSQKPKSTATTTGGEAEDVGPLDPKPTSNQALPPSPFVIKEFTGTHGDFENELKAFGAKYPNLDDKDGTVTIDALGVREWTGMPLRTLVFPARYDAKVVKKAVLTSGEKIVGYAIEIKLAPLADDPNNQYGMLVYTKDSTGAASVGFYRTNFVDLARLSPFTEKHGIVHFAYNPRFNNSKNEGERRIFKTEGAKEVERPGAMREILVGGLRYDRTLNVPDELKAQSKLFGLPPFLQLANGTSVTLPGNAKPSTLKFVLPVASNPNGQPDRYIFFTDKGLVAGVLPTGDAMRVLLDIGTKLNSERVEKAEARDKGVLLQGDELEKAKTSLKPHFPELSAQQGDQFVTINFNRQDFSGDDTNIATIEKTPGTSPAITTEVRKFTTQSDSLHHYEVVFTVTDKETNKAKRVVGTYSAAGGYVDFRTELGKEEEK